LLDDLFLGIFSEPFDSLIELNNEVFACGKFWSVKIFTTLVNIVTVIAVLHVLVFVVVDFFFIVELVKDLHLILVLKLRDHFENFIILKNLNKTVATLPGLLCSVMLRSTFVLSIDRKTFVSAFQCKLIHYFKDLRAAQTSTKRGHFKLWWIVIDGVDFGSSFMPLKNESG
jgi:uncharacterized membrane protein YjgN (DUF898 family)